MNNRLFVAKYIVVFMVCSDEGLYQESLVILSLMKKKLITNKDAHILYFC